MSTQFDPSFAFQERARELSRFAINGIRIAIFLGGLAAVVLGLFAVFSTEATLAVIALLFGLYFWVIGALRVVTGLVATGLSAGVRVLGLILGVMVLVAGIFFDAISITAGIVVLSVPIQAIGTLAIVAGIFLAVAGVSQLVRALRFGRGVAANF